VTKLEGGRPIPPSAKRSWLKAIRHLLQHAVNSQKNSTRLKNRFNLSLSNGDLL
jgi:hypothetical protein